MAFQGGDNQTLSGRFSTYAPSHSRRVLKSAILPQWQVYWDTSIKGRHTHNLLPKVSRSMQNLMPCTTAFLTGHGPFRTCLEYYERSDTDACDCGSLESQDHDYYHCPLTTAWHIRYGLSPSPAWLQNIIFRPKLLRQLADAYKFLTDLSNLT